MDFKEQLEIRNVCLAIYSEEGIRFIDVKMMYVCYKFFTSHARSKNGKFCSDLETYSPFTGVYDPGEIPERLLNALGTPTDRTLDKARFTMATLNKMGIKNIDKDTLNDDILMKVADHYKSLVRGLRLTSNRETGQKRERTLTSAERFEYRIQVIKEYFEGKSKENHGRTFKL